LVAQTTRCEAPWPLGDKPTIDPQDESFDGGFDAAWTVVSGVPGTVDRHRPTSSPVEVYDFVTIPGAMMVQSGPYPYNHASVKQVLMYQDFELGDRQSWTIALAASHGAYENGVNIGTWINDSTTSPINYPALTPYVGVQIDAEFAQGPRLVATANNAHLTGEQPNQTSNTEEIVLLRITRQGLVYSMDWSNNWGLTWSHVGKHTQSAARTKLWFASQNFKIQNATFPIPVHAVLWGCLGGDGYNPW
jgi:hypothetical protein